MLTSLIALSLMQAPALPAAQSPDGWQVDGNDAGCIAHASYRGGTVLSLFALPGHGGIGFLLQNQAWRDLEDGALYPIEIRFGGSRSWMLEARARREIDRDGPGLFFAVRPGAEGGDGRDFIAEFADAGAMRIAHRGTAVDTLALQGNREATVALAQCLGRLIGGEVPLGGANGERPVRI